MCHKHGISDATFTNGKPSTAAWTCRGEPKKLKAQEDESAKLKRLLADAMLENAALKDLLSKKLVTPAEERDAVAHVQTRLEMTSGGRAALPVAAG